METGSFGVAGAGDVDASEVVAGSVFVLSFQRSAVRSSNRILLRASAEISRVQAVTILGDFSSKRLKMYLFEVAAVLWVKWQDGG